MLAERVLRDERLEIGHEPGRTPEGEVGVQTRLQRDQPKLFESGDFRRDGILVDDVCERSTSPQGEGSAEQVGSAGRVLLEQVACGVSEALEARGVESVGIEP